MTRFAMNCDPSTWPGPDDVDLIQQQEAFEKTADFADLAANIAKRDSRPIDEVVEELPTSGHYGGEYDHKFATWLDRQAP